MMEVISFFDTRAFTLVFVIIMLANAMISFVLGWILRSRPMLASSLSLTAGASVILLAHYVSWPSWLETLIKLGFTLYLVAVTVYNINLTYRVYKGWKATKE